MNFRWWLYGWPWLINWNRPIRKIVTHNYGSVINTGEGLQIMLKMRIVSEACCKWESNRDLKTLGDFFMKLILGRRRCQYEIKATNEIIWIHSFRTQTVVIMVRIEHHDTFFDAYDLYAGMDRDLNTPTVTGDHGFCGLNRRNSLDLF